jgi:hypothetical protein
MIADIDPPGLDIEAYGRAPRDDSFGHALKQATRSWLRMLLVIPGAPAPSRRRASPTRESDRRSDHYADLWSGRRDPRTLTEKIPAADLRDAATARRGGRMTTFLHPDDDADNVDFAESRHTRDKGRVACFLHLRDLVYLHPEGASASAVVFVRKLEAAVLAQKAAREKRLAGAREREAERRREADRQKAAAERAKAEQATVK